ncbi:MAG: NAD(P)H-dependent glycerol-3-phosphate dehydrogenase [Myxococcota bacterium]
MTFVGLGGVGDLMLTCAGGLSRNRQVGLRLAQDQALEDILRELGQVAEGVNTARCIQQLSRRYDVRMPICTAVCRMLFDAAVPGQVLEELMRRELKREL